MGDNGSAGLRAPSPRAGEAESSAAQPHQPELPTAGGNASPVPPASAATPREGLHPSCQWQSGVSSQTLEKQLGSSPLPSPPEEAAEILLSPVLLHLSRKNRKNPTVLARTPPASESIFPALAGK